MNVQTLITVAEKSRVEFLDNKADYADVLLEMTGQGLEKELAKGLAKQLTDKRKKDRSVHDMLIELGIVKEEPKPSRKRTGETAQTSVSGATKRSRVKGSDPVIFSFVEFPDKKTGEEVELFILSGVGKYDIRLTGASFERLIKAIDVAKDLYTNEEFENGDEFEISME